VRRVLDWYRGWYRGWYRSWYRGWYMGWYRGWDWGQLVPAHPNLHPFLQEESVFLLPVGEGSLHLTSDNCLARLHLDKAAGDISLLQINAEAPLVTKGQTNLHAHFGHLFQLWDCELNCSLFFRLYVNTIW